MLLPPPHTTTKNSHNLVTYRPDIDGLRALAVFVVYLFHAFPTIFRGGFIGVDVFFVISGFLISSIIFSQLEKGSFSFYEFYSRRIRRIYPTLITVLSLTLLVCTVFFVEFELLDYFILHDELQQIGKHIAAGAGFISNFILWAESGYFDATAITKPLLHLWSLGIEEQFYICWPLILWLAWKKKLNFFYVSGFIALASFILNLYLYKTNPTADFYSPLSRTWELLSGAMLAYLTLHPECLEKAKEKLQFITKYKNKDHILSTIGFVFLITSVLVIKTTSHRFYPGAWALMPIISTVLIIAAGPNGWFNKYILSNKVLVWFGLISYPMYLFHWPLLSFGQILYRDKTPWTYRIGSLFVCILLAWLTTRFIEKPLRFGQYSKAKTIGLFTLMCAIGIIGFVTYKNVKPCGLYAKLHTIQVHDHDNNPGFKNGCNDGKHKLKNCPFMYQNTNKPNLLIWGDSHAAHLMPGLDKYFGKQFNLVQRTNGGKLPTFNATHGNEILNEIIKERPQYIVLVGYWSSYSYPKYLPHLEKTIATLKQNNFKHIVIIGDVPVWEMRLPKLLISTHYKTKTFPNRIITNANNFAQVNLELSQKAKQWGVTYISLVDKLCTKKGCLTYVHDDIGNVLYFDSNHLTNAGSLYVGSLLANDSEFKKFLQIK